MKRKFLIYLVSIVTAITPVYAEVRLSTAELKGEWVVIFCPKNSVSTPIARTITLRANTITSMLTYAPLAQDAEKSNVPYPVNIQITTSELASGGVNRTLDIPAGTNETAPALMQKLIELINEGLRQETMRGRLAN